MTSLLDEIHEVDFIHPHREWSVYLDVSLTTPMEFPHIWLHPNYLKVRMIGESGNLHVAVPCKPKRVFVSYNGGETNDSLTVSINDKLVDRSLIANGFKLQNTSGLMTFKGTLDDINHIVIWNRYAPQFTRRMFGNHDVVVDWKKPVPKKRELNEFQQRMMRE